MDPVTGLWGRRRGKPPLWLILFAFSGLTSCTPMNSDPAWWSGPWTAEGAGPAEEYHVHFQPEGNRLRFQLQAFSGAHTGAMEGLASLQGEVARYEEPAVTGEGQARLLFQRVGETIQLSAENTSGYGGMGISFDGRIFHRGPAPDQNFFLSRGPRPLLTEDEEVKLRQMTTLDYPLFVTNLHLASVSTLDTPEFRGKQVDGFVRGMANTCAAIILVDEQGRMAAAVTDPASDEIRLYSEWPGDSIPAVMQSWKLHHLHPVFRWVRK